MRYRREDENGDYTFGKGDDTWLINSPECVAQAIRTRFLLWYGQWFLDTTEGTHGFSRYSESRNLKRITWLSENEFLKHPALTQLSRSIPT